jgi:hypothetical protein
MQLPQEQCLHQYGQEETRSGGRETWYIYKLKHHQHRLMIIGGINSTNAIADTVYHIFTNLIKVNDKLFIVN